MKTWFILGSAFLLLGCAETLEIQLQPNVTLYFSDESKEPLKLTDSDQEHSSLNRWLLKNNADWYSTSGRYPGGIYVKSGPDGIQVTKTHVILYSTELPEPKALYIQKIEPHELQGLRKFLGKTG